MKRVSNIVAGIVTTCLKRPCQIAGTDLDWITDRCNPSQRALLDHFLKTGVLIPSPLSQRQCRAISGANVTYSGLAGALAPDDRNAVASGALGLATVLKNKNPVKQAGKAIGALTTYVATGGRAVAMRPYEPRQAKPMRPYEPHRAKPRRHVGNGLSNGAALDR